ncbi:5-methyltetrahydropteroyltriglutamate-homocysteine methyltransferase [Gracilibacillus boraciitolerans JCM 21714]|uniref:5-methyltetrahydropteroyltriglutamate--homocysteine methyltransferase n=1 Tax=Gracilibacillus boraciitolerans JCM 21714 TaxID=1298598 RepID=W4VNQ1_9BACI|nr:5-methyltetrahydropteroyltriglutamate--homocysteine S-methyltransferase [Gracilibacillus boraciitolerans]GAE94399.1 5-methyltetrahydropteroyltriglutamate-homocysteine methyltransferase [Gracilibacillus boraciitolerans JCM 21714]
MTTILSSNLGYPRIGKNREWKRAIEAYWQGDITEKTLKEQTQKLRLQNLQKQKEQGIDLIPVGDFSLYDHVLDTAVSFNIIPKRFQDHNPAELSTYFAIARGGEKDAVAAEMTKWFNTNYHYIVPELNDTKPKLLENRALYYYQEAKEELGIDGKPVIIGPVTFVKLAKGYEETELEAWVDRLLPLYEQILSELAEAGASWVQIDEPVLGTNLSEKELKLVEKVYQNFDNKISGIQLILQTYFETVQHYQRIIKLPVDGFGLDFVHGDHLSLIQKYGFPADKVLGAGIINGRNVWRANLENKFQLLADIEEAANPKTIIVQGSSSLVHVPVTKNTEEKLDTVVKDGLSFADEKLTEIKVLTTALKEGQESVSDAFTASVHAIERLDQSDYRNQTVEATAENIKREVPFEQRKKRQQAHLNLPLLPTTTIGSLPQTLEVKRTRTKWRKGELTDDQYNQFVQSETRKWIQIQEDLELDVLVHGEFERTDMVEYFGEKLKGFAVTEFGWVQSYGSRCVKPPLLAGNVEWEHPITVKEIAYAQSLTDKPVKGMLTGPVTILNWSFVHEELPRFTVQDQIGLALEKEVLALEDAGVSIIQVDEPALREGLPLDRLKWPAYFDAAVRAFRLATSTVKPETQIHTHMCYSEFGEIYEAIDGLDADVISIETSRSHGEMVETFEINDYKKDIGLGVYDIHSPRVPSIEELEANINRALETIDVEQFWINPDCGLKTRKEPETIAALKKMVEAAKLTREKYISINQK